jgi:hypothetical protein
MSTHHLQLFAEDGWIQPRLTCTATPDAACRRRPVDPELESWTDEDETTPGHECWAVEWIEDAGWDTVTAADGILSSVDVEVAYDEGMIVDLTTPQPTLPDLAEPSDAEVRAAASAMFDVADEQMRFPTKFDRAPESLADTYRRMARAALVAAREVARHE